MKTEALEVVDQEKMVVAPLTPGDVGIMLREMVKGEIKEENVKAVDKVVDLYERLEKRQAQKEFLVAFHKLQAEIPKIVASTAVPNNDGTIRYRFASFKQVMEQAKPILEKHGFTVDFDQDTAVQPPRIGAICILSHIEGHSERRHYAVRIGSGPPKATETQADGSAMSYAKRGALCNALNIVVEGVENDAREEGPTITQAQADDFRKRVKATKSNEEAFLNFAGGVDRYEKIPASRWGALDRILKKKEAAK